MKLTHGLFCIVSLIGVYAVAATLFPLAAKSKSDIEYASVPQSAELFDDVDLGEFGQVPVLDLVEYYIENPPIAEAVSGTQKKTRFQGC